MMPYTSTNGIYANTGRVYGGAIDFFNGLFFYDEW